MFQVDNLFVVTPFLSSLCTIVIPVQIAEKQITEEEKLAFPLVGRPPI